MNEAENPYPEFLIIEVSRIEVPNRKHQIGEGDYRTGEEYRRVIKKVMKSEEGIVMVFDEYGGQIPEYQGRYEEVRDRILRDAPPEAVFGYITRNGIGAVPRGEW